MNLAQKNRAKRLKYETYAVKNIRLWLGPVEVEVVRVGRVVVSVTCTDDTEHLVAIRGGHGAEAMVEVAMSAMCARMGASALAEACMHGAHLLYPALEPKPAT